MAPIPSDNESVNSGSSVSGSDAPANQSNGVAGLEDGKEEFHTDDSDASDVEVGADAEAIVDSDEESDEDPEQILHGPAIPLLPDHLLKPTALRPAPTPSNIPWAQLTRQQKRARRNNSRKMKKRTYDNLAASANGTGTLEAGKVAQVNRGVVPVGKKRGVRSGRVEKNGAWRGGDGKVKISGRQRLVEGRKRQVGVSAKDGMGGRKARSKR